MGNLAKVILIISIVALTLSEAKKGDKKRFTEKNICENTERKSKVHCYCEQSAIRKATKAECWVFNGGIEPSDQVWMGFKNQPLIESLVFNVRADGGLSFIPSHALTYLEHINYFRIEFASIDTVPKYAFVNSSTIKEIVLIKDEIKVLEKYSFARMQSLVNVTVTENQFTEISRNVFFDLPNLRRLILSNNNISIIHENAFEHLSNLDELSLDDNEIAVLTRETFVGLGNLKKLYIRSNKISMLGDLTFSELWKLQILMLDNNNIVYLAKRAFDGPSELNRLTLTGNSLEIINEGLFEGVRRLILLDLRNNHLQTFTYETVKPIVDNLKESPNVMYLNGNNFACDCRLSWIQALRNETKSEQLRTSLEQITCVVDQQLNSKLIDVPEPSTKPEIVYDNEYGEESYADEPSGEAVISKDHRKVYKIPADLLPCPQSLQTPEVVTSDEIKYYNGALRQIGSVVFVFSMAALNL